MAENEAGSMFDKWKSYRAPLGLILLVMLTYANALSGKYCCDDVSFIVERAATFRDPANLSKLVSKDYGLVFGELSYRPLVTLTYFGDAILFGMHSTVSRAFNQALHAALVLSLFALWRKLYGAADLAFLAAAFFAVHPFATEPVNSTGFREEILAGLAIVWALRELLEWMETGKPRALVIAVLVWTLGLFSKEPVVMVAVLAPMLLFRNAGRKARLEDLGGNRVFAIRMAWGVGVFTLALAFFAVAYLHFSYSKTAMPYFGGRGAFLGFLNFCRTLPFYFRVWIVPANLSVGHYWEVVGNYSSPQLWAGFAFFLFMGAFSVWAWWKGKVVGAGMAWTCIMFLPFTQILPSPQLLADRYFYLPMMGFSLSAAAFALWLRRALVSHGTSLKLWYFCVGFLIVAWMMATAIRNRDWRDDLSINEARYSQWKNAEGRTALGTIYCAQNRREEAEQCFRDALALDPNIADAHRGLALLLMMKGDWKESRRLLERALELAPDNLDTKKAIDLWKSEAPTDK
jgi:hypothetical protein